MSVYAQVNIKLLTQTVESCQKDALSPDYYKQINLNVVQYSYEQNIYQDDDLKRCIKNRYHYSLVLSKFPWLVSTGEALPGYPGAVIVGKLANDYPYSSTGLLDCIASQDPSNQDCILTYNYIAIGQKVTEWTTSIGFLELSYLAYVCPSCVIAHNDVSGSKEKILISFMKWFLTLDKPQRRELLTLLGDDNNAYKLREALKDESTAAIEEYEEARARVEQQDREQRRRELLGQ
ncbi:hypothetical protein H6G80_32965 [Nostoc sp. FACHB-87]|uniref:hypothetical protein n=1 Tax=Nostocaceae TaxID=1162 RepID=UPI001687BB90|nr:MULTISPECIES: hypothetical protein [Nostocaceae]MBD2303111.1 hypothetical protein [Nostoc sp. FACHB-190]MBD2458853.1 hypothetical protein [Nostoc sp. FACHB-87]MBD2479906.1 hypothetical protein [Anabaena sp. FACHB-83]